MLIYSMGVSVDGFIADRVSEFAWTGPSYPPRSWTSRPLQGVGGP